jgi:8-oxo-dGTP diphosphatase
MPKPALSIALAIIQHPTEPRYLIALRKSEAHLGGFWEFPGGKCRSDEIPAECAVREAREEVGLCVTIEDAWTTITHEYPERVVTLHPFLCRAEEAQAQSLENAAVCWATLEELGTFAFPPANAPLLARLLSPLVAP